MKASASYRRLTRHTPGICVTATASDSTQRAKQIHTHIQENTRKRDQQILRCACVMYDEYPQTSSYGKAVSLSDMVDWANTPMPFDTEPSDYQVLFDRVAHGAQP
jgi:hypothetical protein